MSNAIATFENKEYGLKTYVTAHHKGFAVSLQDTDSGEFVPSVTIYRDQAEAIFKAKQAVR